MNALVSLVVLIPLMGAAAALITGRQPRIQAVITVGALAAVLVVAGVLLYLVDVNGSIVVNVGGWPAPWGIVLVVDRLAALMVVVSAAVLLSVLIYTIGQGLADGDDETPVSIYNPTYLILSAGVFNAFIAGDLFNLYVGFEILLAASYVLLTLGGTRARIRAGITYIVVSLLSSLLFLASIAMIYGATGTVNIAQVAVRIGELPADVQLIIHIMLLVAFGIKAAVFPLSFWLPDSYPTAPAPVTAVFAGLLTKVGVYAIIRAETVIFPDKTLAVPLLIVALLTLVVGVRRRRPGGHQTAAFIHAAQPHRLYDLRNRPRDGGRHRCSHLLRHPPHHSPDDSVPGHRPGRTNRRDDVDQPAGRAPETLPVYRAAVFHSRPEPRRHPAILGVHREARAFHRRCRVGRVAGVRGHCRWRHHVSAHPVRPYANLEHGVLAA